MIAIRTTTTDQSTPRPRVRRPETVAAASLVGGAVFANLAFVALGSVFDYPDVLLRPTAEIVSLFQANRTAVVAWFAVLAVAAALMAPAAIALGRLGATRAARWSVRAGVAAAVVQVVGLSRWIVLIPGLASTASDPTASEAARQRALDRIELAHNLLGKGIGETLGYALTATWTVLVLIGYRHVRGGRVSVVVGAAAAGLIGLGTLTPLGVPGTDEANFAGYVLWSLWVIALAIRLVRSRRSPDAAATLAA